MIECILLIAGLIILKVSIWLMLHGINVSLAIAYRLDALRRTAGNAMSVGFYASDKVNGVVKLGAASATSGIKVVEATARVAIASVWTVSKLALRGILIVLGWCIDGMIAITVACWEALLIWDAILLVVLACICGFYMLLN